MRSGKQHTAGTIARLCAASAFCALSMAWSHARADETTSALLDLLKAKGAITQSEYDKIKARQQADAKDTSQKLQAAETKARDAEAKAREAEAKAREAEAKAQSDSAASAAEIAKVKAQTLTAADMPVPGKMQAKSPVEYVTVLPNCVGIRVGEVDICTKGDISFFGVEQFPDKNANAPFINGGLAAADQKNSNAIRGGLLPSSFQVSLATHQAGMDIGVYLGIYTGGNNVFPDAHNANGAGSPISLGTPGIDFRQFFGTIGTPTWGTVKIGRDIGIFASDAILNDLTLFGVGSPSFNAAPSNTSLGRIGLGYIYADFMPQITYKTPVINGFYAQVGAFTPLNTVSSALEPVGLTSTFFTGHDLPMFQGKLSWTGTIAPDAKLTLSTSGVWQRQLADCTGHLDPDGFCLDTALPDILRQDAKVDAWAVDGFAMLDLWGWNFVAYGYTGKGVGTTGLFVNGIDPAGGARKSDGGYLQAAYTFNKVFTLGGSWGVSRLQTANSADNAAQVNGLCEGGFTGGVQKSCLVKENQSWIGFARYKLTKWVNLQAEFIATKSENQIGQTIKDNAVAVGTTFFW